MSEKLDRWLEEEDLIDKSILWCVQTDGVKTPVVTLPREEMDALLARVDAFLEKILPR